MFPEHDLLKAGGARPTTPASDMELTRANKEDHDSQQDGDTPSSVPKRLARTLSTRSLTKPSSLPASPSGKTERQETRVGGDVSIKLEAGEAPKLARSSSRKVLTRAPPTFSDWPDAKAEAFKTFDQLTVCTYANKYMGLTDHVLECDCSEEWDSETRTNQACGEDSDCINRATKMECDSDCGCGDNCQNQRFQRKEWADVTVIKTPKKGFGLRANEALEPNQFIFEYIGEVIGENAFVRRRQQYHDEGIKHFYFMSLTKDEFVDATRKGNLGRFCNHSCNPNCYVDKWVVGERLRMGIFAERRIAAGEELTFNYNVDRYGADPQPCYCEEPNCTGFIGGKTQTQRATKLSSLTIEALGIEDSDDWDLAVARRPRKKKTEEDDEEYVDSVQPKSLDEGAVQKVMASLMQCKEKWLVVKLLNRLQTADEERIHNRIVRMHGYRILKTTLSTWMDDVNVVLQVFDILYHLPRITRNKIQDSNIEEAMQKLTQNADERVKEQAEDLLKIWGALEIGYRIKKREPGASGPAERPEREDRRRERSMHNRLRSKSPSKSPPRGPAMQHAPTGPRSGLSQRPSFRPPRRSMNFLPEGWFSATNQDGKTYYYNASGTTTWERPTARSAPPPPPPKDRSNNEKLQEIINSITVSNISKPKPTVSEDLTPHLPTPEIMPVADDHKLEKWRNLPSEKQMRLYENTLAPHIQHVMSKYKGRIDRDDLKRFAKEIGKKLVQSDFKRDRVEDPTKISAKRASEVRKHVAEYFDKAVAKKSAHDMRKSISHAASKLSHRREHPRTPSNPQSTTPIGSPPLNMPSDLLPTSHKHTASPFAPPAGDTQETFADAMDLSEDDADEENNDSALSLTPDEDHKRKREADESSLNGESLDAIEAMQKKIRVVETSTPPPPPPPPPPPSEGRRSGQTPTNEHVSTDIDTPVDTMPSLNSISAPDRIIEAGMTPQEDVRGSFTNAALAAVAGAPDSFEALQADPSDDKPAAPAPAKGARQDLTAVMNAMRRSMR